MYFKKIKIFNNSVLKLKKPLLFFFFKLTKGGFPSTFYILTSFFQRFISVKLNYFLPSSWPETTWKLESNAGLGFHWNWGGEGHGVKWSGLIKNFLPVYKSNGRLRFSAAKIWKFVFSKLMEDALGEGVCILLCRSCPTLTEVWNV